MLSASFLTLVSLAVSVSAASLKRVSCPDGKNTATNAACCAFFPVKEDLLSTVFTDGCSEEVHEVLRLSFHDAIAFSPELTRQGKFGGTGADGSFLLFPDVEPNYHANNGTDGAVDDLMPVFKRHNVTGGDLIQFAAAVGLTLCPGAPGLEFLAGRPNAKQPPPDGLIPEPQDSVKKITARFADAGGFTPTDIVSLLASHSIARADHVDPVLMAVPFDTTPFTFDTQFFLEVLLKGTGFPGSANNVGEVSSPLPDKNHTGLDVGEIRLQSDFAFAHDPSTACSWQSQINNQKAMMSRFQEAMKRLAIVGHNRASLIDCSEVLPHPAPPVTKPATYPATKSRADVQQACILPFPTLSSDHGPATDIPHCPDGGQDCDDSGS